MIKPDYWQGLRAAANGRSECVTTEELNDLKATQTRCGYCDCLLTPGRTHVEHMVPVGRRDLRGAMTIDNLAMACRDCNYKKGRKTPIEWALLLWDKTSQFKTINLRTGNSYIGPVPNQWRLHLRRLAKERGLILAPQYVELLRHLKEEYGL